jgi:putative phosphoesterase
MADASGRILIGLISDTHGLLRPSVHRAFEGVDLILHAGDVGGPDILDELRIIAPVQAVFGNTDPPGDPNLEERIIVQHGGVDILVSHGHELGNPTPAKLLAAYSQRVIVYGHTHKQLVTAANGRLVINPGAAGARRFRLEPSVARLAIENGNPEVEIVPLD